MKYYEYGSCQVMDLPPKQLLALVNELLFFLEFSSMVAGGCGGSGVSTEKLFMRMLNFFRRGLGGLSVADTVLLHHKFIFHIIIMT